MRMAFATELGGGLGHVARLAPWRAHFESRGIATLGVLPDLRAAADAPDLVKAPYLQAPRLAHGPSLRAFDPSSFAEMLVGAGYGSATVLGALVDAWRHLFAIAAVDALVIDHAPTALLAARAAALPVLHIGDGFTMPAPGKAGAPYFAADARRDPERFSRAGRLALSCINAVLEARGVTPLSSLDALPGTGMPVIASYPELDHRGAGRDAAEFAGHFAIAAPDRVGWKALPGPRVFAYLKPGAAAFDAVLALLGRHAGQVRVHAQGLVRQDAPGPAVWDWSEHPLPTSAMAGCDMVVCHAGHGTVCEALLAGKPLFLLPQVLEQMLTAQNVAALGAGAWYHPSQETRVLRRDFRRVLEGGEFGAAARAFADRHGHGKGAARLAEIADRFLGLARTDGAGYIASSQPAPSASRSPP